MNNVEIEKKYIFNEYSTNPFEEFKIVKNLLDLKNPKYIINSDTYYDTNDILKSMNINVRKRETNNNIEYTIKRKINDKDNILRRYELNFKSIEEVLSYLNNEWNIEVNTLDEKLKLVTKRCLYNIEMYNGLYELVFDKTTPYVDGIKHNENYMIECEYKKGNINRFQSIIKLLEECEYLESTTKSKKDLVYITSIKKLSLHK